VTVEADYKDVKSILDIRYVNQDAQQTRINFPAVTAFPLKKGATETVFSCLHNSGSADMVGNNKFVMDLLDQNGKPIHSYTYTGDISGAMMGVKDEFVPNKDYDKFSLVAKLYTDGKLVDSAEMKYDCSLINPAKCSQVSASSGNTLRSMLIIFIIILTVIGLIAVLVRKLKSSRPNNSI